MADVSTAIVARLRPLLDINRDRLLRTLTPDEVNAVSVAAVSAYIRSRNKGDKTYGLRVELDDPIDDLFA